MALLDLQFQLELFDKSDNPDVLSPTANFEVYQPANPTINKPLH